jgi:hypothetical protein
MVELFFAIITRQAIRRGTHRSVEDLIAAIGILIDGWNDRCKPFTWTKTADELLPHCKPVKELRSRDTSAAVTIVEFDCENATARHRRRNAGAMASAGPRASHPLASMFRDLGWLV